MKLAKKILGAFSGEERRIILIISVLFIIAALLRISIAFQEGTEFIPTQGGSYIEGVLGEPSIINPIVSTNQADEDISALVYGRLSDLVANYDIDETNHTYTLKLKDDLLWSDNEPLTSDDVIFTLRTIENPDARSPLANDWQGVSFERISALQVKLTLPTPYAFFIHTIERLPIIPKHIFGAIPPGNMALSAYALEPVGSGPYKFKDFTKRKDGFITRYHLVINENYAGQKPFIEDFYFQFYENSRELMQAFRLRQISGFGTPSPDIDDLSNSSYTNIVRVPMPRYYAIFFNQVTNPLFKDKNARLALSRAVPKTQIAKEILGNEDLVIDGPVLPAIVNYGTSTATSSLYDLDAARALFMNVASSSKESITLTVPHVDFLEKTAERVKEAWLALGIKHVTIVSLDETELARNILQGRNYEALLLGNTFENPTDLFAFWHSAERFYPGLNFSLYQNQDVDKLIETIRQTTEDPSTRNSELIKLNTLIKNDGPAIFLFTLPYTYVYTTRLDGFHELSIMNPADRFAHISNWSITRVRIAK